ncbi:MAG: hypothetical protein L6R39_000513 [Caloplaca ligustica]|nr:MAG: hypothetical protein L6R39_000513 [Caloplaca ligustica]
MRFFDVSAIVPLLAMSSQAFVTAQPGNSSSSPELTLAFSGDVTLGKVLPLIRIPGGVRAVEPITGGTFTGPAFNATVDGGIAYPSTFANGTVREPFITIWGTTTGNASFLVQLSGTGVPRRQFARAFLLATIEPSADDTTVAVKGYIVG